jgi:hypothetical protein
MVFQALQAGHCPLQRLCEAPHDWQTYVAPSLAMDVS